MTYADRIPAPRPVPTTRQRMTDAPGCGHTPEQHRHDDGQAADAASHDRAIRELQAELEQVRAERDRWITHHTNYRAQFGAAGEVLAVVRDATEQIERALARYDTAPEVSPVEADVSQIPIAQVERLAARIRDDAQASDDDGVAVGLLRAADGIGDLLARPADHAQDAWGALDEAIQPVLAEAEAPLGSVSPRTQDAPTHPLGRLLHAAERVHAARDTVLPRREALADLAAVVDELGAVGTLDEQALRDRLEHAIRNRLTAFDADEAITDQWAAVAATAAVAELRQG